MSKVVGFVEPFDIVIRRKIGKSGDEAIWPYCGIYQMRKCKVDLPSNGSQWHYKKVPIKMKFYSPGPPIDPGQIAAQDKFRAGVAAWQALTVEQKVVYNIRVARLKMFGYNLFLREYMLS